MRNLKSSLTSAVLQPPVMGPGAATLALQGQPQCCCLSPSQVLRPKADMGAVLPGPDDPGPPA